MSDDATSADLLTAALALVEAEGWGAYSPLRLAQAAGVGLGDACLQVPDAASILLALGRRADGAMLDVAPDELLEMTPKERVFELMMRRFDALAFARPALRRLWREAGPEAWVAALGSLARAMKHMVEASDAAGPGLRGVVAGAALASVYLRVGRVWLDDASADQAATLAALNARLDDVARVLRQA